MFRTSALSIKFIQYYFYILLLVLLLLLQVVRDRVIASWFPDRLALAFGIAVSTMGLGSVLTFLLTSNIAKWIGLSATLFVGKFNKLLLVVVVVVVLLFYCKAMSVLWEIIWPMV
jgi:hypothetical protein